MGSANGINSASLLISFTVFPLLTIFYFFQPKFSPFFIGFQAMVFKEIAVKGEFG